MAKGIKRSVVSDKIRDIAQRRYGSTYQDAYRASKERLFTLRDDYAKLPPSYRGYLAVGICTCMESHIKYFYAHAAERFWDQPEILMKLLSDLDVNIETLISTSARSFALADVVAANISVSSLETYVGLASRFFSVLIKTKHDFPWTYQELFTEGNPDWAKEIAAKLQTVKNVFEARHKFVHETSVLEDLDVQSLDADASVEAAAWLLGEFEKQYWEIEWNPEFGIRPRGSDRDAMLAIQVAHTAMFEKIRSVCEERQSEKLDAFRDAFEAYLERRAEFQASVFVSQQSEEAVGFYCEIAPQYEQTLNHVYLQQQFLRAKYPYGVQLRDMGLDEDTEPSKD